jgi:hypothetical protein
MKNTLFRKGLVVGIIILFFGVSVVPSTGRIDIEILKTSGNDGSLLGLVNDTSGNPIEGALVRVHFHGTYEEDYSDEHGYYHVFNIPICYCMKNATCLKDGYKTEWKLISIAENTTLDFILTSGNNPPDIELQYKLEKYNDKWLYIFEAICSGGTDRVDFTFDDILQETVTGPGPTYTWQFLTSELLRGHTICAIAYDGAGNNASDCIEFRTRSLNIESTNDCDCHSNGKTHLAEKILNRLEKNEILSNVINLDTQGDRPICDFLYERFTCFDELCEYYWDQYLKSVNYSLGEFIYYSLFCIYKIRIENLLRISAFFNCDMSPYFP